ncbi:MAG: DUF4197 domain-containing protein [Cyclobacteriaceae bacterium]|nr:DUF4197 domain-containing protein [Cyclobacteriaceae bacterium HetDA_MAG_MS6]
MISRIPILALLVVLYSCTSAQLQQAQKVLNDYVGDDKLTAGDVANGLKEALSQGASKGANQASAVDGYFKNPQLKIPFPPDVKKVENKLRGIGLNKEVDRFILTLNRGAEEAAKEAKPIFISAITSMTISDAWSILKGENNAATNYLRKTTSAQLTEKFKPVIARALDKTQATKYYGDIVNSYNKIPFVDKVNPDLNDYATQRAIAGLFLLVENEEKNIRKNPGARATELLKKVFSQQD